MPNGNEKFHGREGVKQESNGALVRRKSLGCNENEQNRVRISVLIKSEEMPRNRTWILRKYNEPCNAVSPL